MQESLMEGSNSSTHIQQQQKHMIELSPAEHLIDQINGQGKYQIQSFIIFSVMWFLTSWLLLGMGFFFDSSYTCKDPQYADEKSCQAHICELSDEERSSQIDWHASSIVFQFDTYLICPDHDTFVAVLQSMLFVGAIFGFFVIPYIADNYGRKLALRVAWGIGTVAIMVTCIADSPNMIGLGLFLIGFGTNPAITLCFSFINEICLGRSRARYGVGVQVMWAFGQTTIALIFSANMTWLQIVYIMLVTFIVEFVMIFLYIEETPMYMLKKSSQGALQILNKMAKINKRDELTLEAVDRVERAQQQEFFQEQRSLGFFDLFRYRSIRWTSISAAIIFFGIQVMYYSSQLNQNTVGFTPTINQVIFGISEMIGYLSAELIIDKCLRKKTTFIGMGISAAMCFLLGFLVMIESPQNEQAFKWIETVILMIDRFVLCSFWSIFYVFLAELYPTQIRSLGFGWTSVVGQLGSTTAPFIRQISQAIGVNSWFPTAFFGIVAWCFIFCLHQTLGLPLKDVIAERTQTLRRQKQELQIQDPDEDDYHPKSSPDLNPISQQDMDQMVEPDTSASLRPKLKVVTMKSSPFIKY